MPKGYFQLHIQKTETASNPLGVILPTQQQPGDDNIQVYPKTSLA